MGTFEELLGDKDRTALLGAVNNKEAVEKLKALKAQFYISDKKKLEVLKAKHNFNDEEYLTELKTDKAQLDEQFLMWEGGRLLKEYGAIPKNKKIIPSGIAKELGILFNDEKLRKQGETPSVKKAASSESEKEIKTAGKKSTDILKQLEEIKKSRNQTDTNTSQSPNNRSARPQLSEVEIAERKRDLTVACDVLRKVLRMKNVDIEKLDPKKRIALAKQTMQENGAVATTDGMVEYLATLGNPEQKDPGEQRRHMAIACTVLRLGLGMNNADIDKMDPKKRIDLAEKTVAAAGDATTVEGMLEYLHTTREFQKKENAELNYAACNYLRSQKISEDRISELLQRGEVRAEAEKLSNKTIDVLRQEFMKEQGSIKKLERDDFDLANRYLIRVARINPDEIVDLRGRELIKRVEQHLHGGFTDSKAEILAKVAQATPNQLNRKRDIVAVFGNTDADLINKMVIDTQGYTDAMLRDMRRDVEGRTPETPEETSPSSPKPKQEDKKDKQYISNETPTQKEIREKREAAAAQLKQTLEKLKEALVTGVDAVALMAQARVEAAALKKTGVNLFMTESEIISDFAKLEGDYMMSSNKPSPINVLLSNQLVRELQTKGISDKEIAGLSSENEAKAALAKTAGRQEMLAQAIRLGYTEDMFTEDSDEKLKKFVESKTKEKISSFKKRWEKLVNSDAPSIKLNTFQDEVQTYDPSPEFWKEVTGTGEDPAKVIEQKQTKERLEALSAEYFELQEKLMNFHGTQKECVALALARYNVGLEGYWYQNGKQGPRPKLLTLSEFTVVLYEELKDTLDTPEPVVPEKTAEQLGLPGKGTVYMRGNNTGMKLTITEVDVKGDKISFTLPDGSLSSITIKDFKHRIDNNIWKLIAPEGPAAPTAESDAGLESNELAPEIDLELIGNLVGKIDDVGARDNLQQQVALLKNEGDWDKWLAEVETVLMAQKNEMEKEATPAKEPPFAKKIYFKSPFRGQFEESNSKDTQFGEQVFELLVKPGKPKKAFIGISSDLNAQEYVFAFNSGDDYIGDKYVVKMQKKVSGNPIKEGKKMVVISYGEAELIDGAWKVTKPVEVGFVQQ